MRKLFLATTALLALSALPARAEFILASNTFADLGGTGFGNNPRLLTVQAQGQTGIESGAVISQNGTQAFLSPVSFNGPNQTTLVGIGCSSQQSCNGVGGGLDVTQSNLVNITTFGWDSGANVGVGLDTNQTGSTNGLLFSNLVLNIFNSAGQIVGTFGGNDSVLITQQQLDQQQGNGNSVFNLGLTFAEQVEFDTMLANNPGLLFAGLAAKFGCNPCDAGNADDGAESFLGFKQSAVTAVPEASTWAMMLLGFIGIAGIAGRKQWSGFRLA